MRAAEDALRHFIVHASRVTQTSRARHPGAKLQDGHSINSQFTLPSHQACLYIVLTYYILFVRRAIVHCRFLRHDDARQQQDRDKECCCYSQPLLASCAPQEPRRAAFQGELASDAVLRFSSGGWNAAVGVCTVWAPRMRPSPLLQSHLIFMSDEVFLWHCTAGG
jgi:hypothetical protein